MTRPSRHPHLGSLPPHHPLRLPTGPAVRSAERGADRTRARPPRLPGRRRDRWLRRLGTSLTLTTAGSVLVLGTPVDLPGVGDPAGAGAATAPARVPWGQSGPGHDAAPLALLAASRGTWRGHPGRRLVRYRVRHGDTATGLAVRFHAWTRELRAINRLGRQARLVAGQHLTIPVVVAAVPRRTRKHRTRPHRTRPHRTRAEAHHRPWRHARADRATVRRVIVRTARRHGVDPRTALAIGWQESGWQQRRISSAGAVGAMQVMPGTGRWMSAYVGRRLNLYSLRDNVTAGVVLFKVLRRQTGWRRSVGAYYQGLGAVRRHGFYPDTRRYTRSVSVLHRRLDRGWDPS